MKSRVLNHSIILQMCDILLPTKWVDYVEEPMKYQALRPHYLYVGGWWWWGWWWWWGGWCGKGWGGLWLSIVTDGG